MTWQYRPITDGVTTYRIMDRVTVSRGRFFARTDSWEWATSADLVTWYINPEPLWQTSTYCQASDGTKWYYWIDGNRLAVSTDGIIGASVTITTPVTSPGRLAALYILGSGRMVGYSVAPDYGVWTSDDNGANWTLRATPTGSATGGVRFAEWPDGTITAVLNSDWGMISADGGSTWTSVRPLSGYGLNSLIYTGAQFVAPFYYAQGIAYSDGGSYYVNTANGSVVHRMDASGDTLYEAARVDNVMRVRTHTGTLNGSTVLADFDTTGLHADSYVVDLWVTPGKLVLLSERAGYSEGPRFAEYPLVAPQDLAALDWPITVEAPEYAVLPWDVQVGASSATASLSWPIAVAAASSYALPWPIAALDAAVVADLNGAGTWAAAPAGAWSARVTLDGVDVSDRIVGEVVVRMGANEATAAELSLRPVAALQPLSLIGRRVQIAFAPQSGINAQWVFSGAVDVPAVDVVTGVVTLACTDAAQEAWRAMPRETIAAMVGGRWHAAVSGEPEDGFDYLEERLQSVGASWARDVQGTLRILPWDDTSKTYTILPADVIDSSIAVDLPSRDRLVTRITVRMQYRYPLLRVRYARCRFAADIHLYKPYISATLNYPGATWLTTAMVEGATNSVTGWTLRALDLEHPPARTWSAGVTSGAGFYTISPAVAGDLVLGFTASYAARWRQAVTEDYTIEVVCPALESMVGQPVAEEQGATLESVLDQPGWESDVTMAPLPMDLTLPVSFGDSLQQWASDGATGADRDAAILTLLDRAWVRLWGASRSGRVRFAVPCRPDIWLDAHIHVEAGAVRAAGKCVEITHRLDTASGECVSEFGVAVGLPGNTPASVPTWTIPAPPASDYTPAINAYSFRCGTYVGGKWDSPPFDPDTMIGFSTNLNGVEDPAFEYYPHQLRIKAPDIAAEERDPQTRTSTSTILVDVPTDLLEIV